MDSLTVGLLEISYCQTADLSEMSDKLIGTVRICMETVGQTNQNCWNGQIFQFLDCWIVGNVGQAHWNCWNCQIVVLSDCQNCWILRLSDCWNSQIVGLLISQKCWIG